MLTTLLLTVLTAPSQTQQELQPGLWRAWLDSPGGELAFGLELAKEGERDTDWQSFLINGEERIDVPVTSWAGDELVLSFDHYDSRIVARFDGERLDGEWVKVGGGGKLSRLDFHAVPAAEVFPKSEGASIDVSGRWAVDFASDELGAVGLFEQREGGELRGTFMTATGDYRFLAGRTSASGFSLSCFDGAHAFLFRAKLGEDERLRGDFWSRDSWHETWEATRDPEASLADAFHQTTWDESVSLADLSYPDLDGVERSLGDPAFAGKARIVQLFGSWCPNCHDEAPYLAELDRRYRDRGLSILGIAFEHTGDFERDAEQVRRYAQRHGVEYPLFVAGLSDKRKATQSFPAIDFLRSYPTTIFFDARGRVRSVHSGFAGPATGEAHLELRAKYEALIEELLSEEAPSTAEMWELLTSESWLSRVEFAGARYTFFVNDAGRRMARYTLLGSGVPVISEEELAVRLNGDAVQIDRRVWRFDPVAGVLSDPSDLDARLTPGDRNAGWILERRGLAREADWIGALKDDDARVRREAMVALVRKREVTSGSRLTEALELLDDPSPDVRLHAVWAMGRVREPDAMEALEGLREHPNASVRREVTRALERLDG